MKRPVAFTLVELLVVIVTIVLLMAVSLSVLGRSRQVAEAAICGSNISQLLKGLISYEAENQILPYGFDKQPFQSPPPGGYAGNIAYDKWGWWWFNFIEGFYEKSRGKDTVVCCPSKRLNDPTLKNDVLCGNYGVNLAICKSSDVGTPLCISNIPRPAETLLLVDSGYALISWWHATDNPPVPLGDSPIEDTSYVPGLWINKNRILKPWQKHDAINGRHPEKKVNVGFVDSHVSRTKADNLFVEKTGTDYKNKSPLWVPK